MKTLLPIILVLLFLWSFITAQSLRRLPSKELRQRSRGGQDHASSSIYKLTQYGAAGRFAVWKIEIISLAALLYLAFRYSWWAGVIAVVVAGAVVTSWRPVRQVGSWAWSLAGGPAATLAYLLSLAKPLVESFNRLASRFHKPAVPSGVYEKQDLLELVKAQDHQPDNRIDEQDLGRAAQALSFSDKTVGQAMLPKSDVKWVEASEPVGPSIMDELHQTGQKRFALVKSAKATKPEILGSLYIGDLLKHLGKQAKLRDLMHPGVFYINEASSLEQALGACLKTGSLLLIVVNGRQETVGLLSIEKILGEALGQTQLDDFNDYDDPRLVADHEPPESHQ